jgi:nucleoside-diphosphate-sugar epimerase
MRAGVHHLDLQNRVDVENFFRTFSINCNAVIHLASFPRQKAFTQNPLLASDVMATSLLHLLELTKGYRIPKFVYVSSSMVYGDFKDGVKENAVCNPAGQYGIFKYMGERLVQDYTRRGAFDHVIVRPSAVYGEWDVEDRVVSKFMLSAMRDDVINVHGANEVLDFTHVDDVALGIALAATRQEATNNTYNLTRCAKKPITLLDAAALCIKIAGKGKIDIQEKNIDFPSRGRLNIDKAKADLGYAPMIDIKEGFTRYHNWFKESEFWQARI